VEGDWENPWTNMNSHLSHDSNDVILTENSQHVTICEGNHVTLQKFPFEEKLSDFSLVLVFAELIMCSSSDEHVSFELSLVR
jgi:hypothetical protein